jgi:hypothetical protein
MRCYGHPHRGKWQIHSKKRQPELLTAYRTAQSETFADKSDCGN